MKGRVHVELGGLKPEPPHDVVERALPDGIVEVHDRTTNHTHYLIPVDSRRPDSTKLRCSREVYLMGRWWPWRHLIWQRQFAGPQTVN